MPEVEDSTAQCNRNGLRSISCSKLSENVLDMRFDGARGRAQAVADFLVAESIGDMDQDFCFAAGQSDFREIFNQLLRNLSRDITFTRLNNPNCTHQIAVNNLLEQIASDTGLQRSIHVLVSVIRRQDDNFRFREFFSDG